VFLCICRRTKCKLAKLLNEEKNFREVLEKKDSLIRDKDEKIRHLEREWKDAHKYDHDYTSYLYYSLIT